MVHRRTGKTATQALEALGEKTNHNVYGYDPAYNNCTKFSMGSARKVTVNGTGYAQAKFTFKGTGFDVISLTDNNSGAITVEVLDSNGKPPQQLRVRMCSILLIIIMGIPMMKQQDNGQPLRIIPTMQYIRCL